MTFQMTKLSLRHFKEKAEESKRLRVQQITEGAEEMWLTAAHEPRRNQRICREK